MVSTTEAWVGWQTGLGVSPPGLLLFSSLAQLPRTWYHIAAAARKTMFRYGVLPHPTQPTKVINMIDHCGTFNMSPEEYEVWREFNFNTANVIRELQATRLAVEMLSDKLNAVCEVEQDEVTYEDKSTWCVYDAFAIDSALGRIDFSKLDAADDEEEWDNFTDEQKLEIITAAMADDAQYAAETVPVLAE